MKRVILGLSAATLLSFSIGATAEQEVLTKEDFEYLQTETEFCEFLGGYAYRVAEDRDSGVSEGDSRGFIAKWIVYDYMRSMLFGVTESVYEYPRLAPADEYLITFQSCMDVGAGNRE